MVIAHINYRHPYVPKVTRTPLPGRPRKAG
jgi:hypothetical protein